MALRCAPRLVINSLVTQYIQLRLTVLLSGAIRNVLVHPGRPTARIGPMRRIIQVIPTFGIGAGVTSAQRGTNLLIPSIPASQAARITGTVPGFTATRR